MSDRDRLLRYLERENARLTRRNEELEAMLLHVVGKPWAPSPAETAEALADDGEPAEVEDHPGYTERLVPL